MSEQKMKKEDVLAYAHGLVDLIMSSYQEGDWVSISHNTTAGPKEAPIHMLAIAPGTTKENAVNIQQRFLESGAEANKG